MRRLPHCWPIIKRPITVCVALLVLVTFPGFAQNRDQALLEQLYNEIITASSGTMAADDTAGSGRGSTAIKSTDTSLEPLLPPAPSDAATEHLRNEIDRMMQDVKIRHDDAVRFMQETK